MKNIKKCHKENFIIVSCSGKNKGIRHALSVEQQKAFIEAVKTFPEYYHWYPLFATLLGTGMRIGECLGLTWEDVNFKERYISVNHNFIERPDPDHGMKIVSHIQTTKTDAGIRTIPMVDEVYEAFIMEYQIQQCIGFCEEEIDGYSSFIFSTAQGRLYRPGSVNDAIHRATNKYNRLEKAAAKKNLISILPCLVIIRTVVVYRLFVKKLMVLGMREQ